jgi:quercetin dioxygenase-like cupin family protein
MPMLRREAGETITSRETREVLLLADGAEMSITWTRYGAGERGPGLHVHREHIDAFYVLEGELTFHVGPAGDPVRVGPGGFVAVPPDVGHGFANESDADATWLNFHAPDAGFAQYLRDARDGKGGAFDSFDPPPDGGLPGAGVVVIQAGGEPLSVALPGLTVTEQDGDPPAQSGDWRWELGGGRVLCVSPRAA